MICIPTLHFQNLWSIRFEENCCQVKGQVYEFALYCVTLRYFTLFYWILFEDYTFLVSIYVTVCNCLTMFKLFSDLVIISVCMWYLVFH